MPLDPSHNQTRNQCIFRERERESKARMEVGMSLNALIRLPMSNISRTIEEVPTKHSYLFSSLSTTTQKKPAQHRQQRVLVVKAKGKKGMMNRQFQQRMPPPLPKIEEDGNPKFVIFICSAKVCTNFVVSLCFFLGLKFWISCYFRVN